MDILLHLLELVKEATGIDAVPFLSSSTGNKLPAITYEFYRFSNNGAVSQYRFLTRIHSKSLEQSLDLSDKLNKTLVSLGDETSKGLLIKGNGGGSLLDDATNIPQVINYFDIVVRS